MVPAPGHGSRARSGRAATVLSVQDPPQVAGVDGCRGGWIVVRAAVGPATRATPLDVGSVEVVDSLDGLLDDVRRGRVVEVAVDMPIGLPDHDPRACDVAARAMAGPRRASVFPAPCRAVLGAADHGDALRRSRAATGRGLSLQSWHLVPRIAELDDALVELAPRARRRVHEAFPELAFAHLRGAPMTSPKRLAAGRRERLAVLRGRVPERLRRRGASPPGSVDDDLLDALVLAVRAAQWAGDSDRPVVLGDGRTDARGHRCEIRA
jgi:predicted RNase H-like nuclease